MTIRCKVAHILSDQELIITAGSTDGVEEGMVFRVMGKIKVQDPDSKEVLDEMPFVKVQLKASVVRPKISIVTTYGRTSIERSMLRGLLEADFTPPERFDYIQKEGVGARDSTVYVGDQVVNVPKKMEG